MEWILQKEPDINIDGLFQKSFEQWLLADLKDSGVPCLPQEIFDRKECQMVDGTFILQIQGLFDIGKNFNSHSL